MCRRKVWGEGLLRKRGGMIPTEVVLGCYPESEEIFIPNKERKMATRLEELEAQAKELTAQAKELTATIAKLKAEAEKPPSNWPKKIEPGMVFRPKGTKQLLMAARYPIPDDTFRWVSLTTNTGYGPCQQTIFWMDPVDVVNPRAFEYLGMADDVLNVNEPDRDETKLGRLYIEEHENGKFSFGVEQPFKSRKGFNLLELVGNLVKNMSK